MKHDRFDELKTYIGFDEQDEVNLRSLAEPATPLIPRVVDRFYEVLLGHPNACPSQKRYPGEKRGFGVDF